MDAEFFRFIFAFLIILKQNKLQFSVDGYHHSDKARKPSHKVGNRFCQKDTMDTETEAWQKKYQRDDDDYFSEYGEEYSPLGVT